VAKHNVFLNSRSIIHKGSGDKAIGGPDVCKTPVGPAVVPIPYPNISNSADLKKGSKSVKINNQPAALKGSVFSSSIGDQAGSLGGIVSGKTGGETEFLNYAFDMRIEGRNVVRHADTTMHNNKNALGMVIGSMTAPIAIKIEDTTKKCPYCKKDEHAFTKERGTNNGNGQALRKNIIKNIKDHPWYTKSNSLEAHHLICSESMDSDNWYQYCMDFGYDINHKNNGVMLPYYMDLACQLGVPIHRSNHSAGRAEGLSYPDKIKLDLAKILNKIEAGNYCDDPKGLIEDLNDYSELIIGKVDKFKWTITGDGKDYKQGNNGCAGVTSITDKPNQPCSVDRQHDLTSNGTTNIIPRKTHPLEIGK
jgi:uncharacterized Zn-binding protein involved in type VI secretion